MRPPGVEAEAKPRSMPAAPPTVTPLPRPLVLVAAVARNRVIGRDGSMPWHLPGDLARFRAVTTGHALLMGRRTFEAIGRPLPDRLSTVLTSRGDGWAPPGVAVAGSLSEAITSADRQSATLGGAAVMVIGGGAVYAATLGSAAQLLITEVDAAPDGDTAFPVIDADLWRLAEAGPVTRGPADSHPYRFTRWELRAGGSGAGS